MFHLLNRVSKAIEFNVRETVCENGHSDISNVTGFFEYIQSH